MAGNARNLAICSSTAAVCARFHLSIYSFSSSTSSFGISFAMPSIHRKLNVAFLKCSWHLPREKEGRNENRQCTASNERSVRDVGSPGLGVPLARTYAPPDGRSNRSHKIRISGRSQKRKRLLVGPAVDGARGDSLKAALHRCGIDAHGNFDRRRS